MTDATTSAEIENMERRRCTALVARDYDTLATLIHADLMYTHSNSIFDTKDSLLAGLRAGDFCYKRIDRSSIQARIYGETALVTGIADMDAEWRGQPVSARVRYSIAWARSGGQWQYVLWHAVPLAT
jgi:hypothetical protein